MDNFGKQRELDYIDPTKIKLNDDKVENSYFRNARSTLKKEEMATNRESIRKLGLLKPLIVRSLSNDEDGFLYQLVCGSRRLRNILRLRQEAVAILKENRHFKPEELCYCPETAEWHPAYKVYETVKCFVRECDDDTAIRINIAENLEHAQVPEIDLMEFCQELVTLKKDNLPRYTRAEVAELCNRCESWVSLTLDLAALPDKIKDMMYDNRITRTGALAFLQTDRDKLDDVIEVSEELVRQEKLVEVQLAEEELHRAEIDLSEAQNDVLIQEMMQNNNLLEIAKKKENTHRKRVSAASEKRDAALNEVENPKFTADVINKANLIVPGAKKGKPKTMPAKEIKVLYNKFVEFKNKQELNSTENIVFDTIKSLFEVILGHRLCSIENIIEEAMEKMSS